MKKNFLIGLVILIFGLNTYAITPQKYCESLAATSCEVLNYEFINDPNEGRNVSAVVYKYCRNRDFKMVRYSKNASAVDGSLGYLTVTNPRSSTYTINVYFGATACGQSYYDPLVGATPSYLVLP